VIGQLHAYAALPPGKNPTVPVRLDGGLPVPAVKSIELFNGAVLHILLRGY